MIIQKNLAYLLDEFAEGKQIAFSEKTKIPRSSLNTYLKKGNVPKHEHLLSLANELNVNLHWFLTGNGSPLLKKNEEYLEISQKFNEWCKELINAGTHTEEGIFIDIREAERRFDRWMIKREKQGLQDNTISDRKVA